MTCRVSFLPAGVVLLAVGVGAVVAGQVGEPPDGGWSLAFVDNPQLPPVFREFAVTRPDGSSMRAYLADFAKDREKRKPLMIYLDGSGAGSLFTMHDGHVAWSMFGVLAKEANEQFHVAATDKRGVPFLNEAHGTGDNAPDEYTRHATYDGRVAEARLLLDALLKQPAIDASRVVVVGHSEGADVAAGLAAVDDRVTHVAFLAGGGPTQMFDLIVLRRKQMTKEGAAPARIERAVEQLQDDYRQIMADPTSVTEFFQGHAYRRWSTFFQNPPADNLLKTKAKIYAAHGSEDTSGPIEAFDYLAVELIRAGRTDAVIRRFPNRDHGFRDVDKPAAGPPMRDVFAEIVQWATESAKDRQKPRP